MRRAALLPALVMLPWRRLGPEECSPGTRPTKAMSLRGESKRKKSCSSATSVIAAISCTPRRLMQRLHERLQAPVGQRVAHGLLEPCDARGGLGDRVQVFLEPDLLSRVLHLHRGQPAQVRRRPGALAGVGDAVAQQQRLEPVAGVTALAHSVIASTHQITHGLVGRTGHPHRGEFARRDPVAPATWRHAGRS